MRRFASLWVAGTGLSLTRGLIMSSAYLAFILSIAAMPMADSVAIYFAMPLFVAVIAGPMLGERVRLHRWIAIIGGFIGVMIMINPGEGVFEPAALLALYSAFGYAISQTLARRVVRDSPPAAMAFHTNAVYLIVAISLALAFTLFDLGQVEHKSLAFLARPWQWPTLLDLAAMLLLGATVAIAMVLFGMAYKYAESSFVAPFEYTRHVLGDACSASWLSAMFRGSRRSGAAPSCSPPACSCYGRTGGLDRAVAAQHGVGVVGATRAGV